MRMTGQNKIYMYNVQFGAEVDLSDTRKLSQVYRNLKGDLIRIYGLYNPYGTSIFSTTLI